MHKMGLNDCIPRRKRQSETDSRSQSLCSIWNRNMDNWEVDHIELNEGKKRSLLAALVQIMILLMTSTTCYKFGGNMYKQVTVPPGKISLCAEHTCIRYPST